MNILYKSAVQLYRLGIRIAALRSPKARAWQDGRVDLFEKIKTFRAAHPGYLVWFHCASLGEFEQGRPVIEGLRRDRPEAVIVVTFYSPSGYEIRKNYAAADGVFYLPLDTEKNAEQFLSALLPDLVVFVKYEFWYYHLKAVKNRHIPLLLISALFRKKQLFFKAYGGAYRKMLPLFDRIFVQDKTSADLLQSIDYQNFTLAGDTRTDRTADIAASNKRIEKSEVFAGKSPVLVCGSTWSPDEDLLTAVMTDPAFADWKFIIAPHEIHAAHLNRLEAKISLPCVRFSAAGTKYLQKARVLIIDNIGMLSALYRYGAAAYIGGGFGVGIHNTLEPAAYGIPVIFGKKYKKFAEAVSLVQTGGGFSVQTAEDLRAVFLKLNNADFRAKAGAKARVYIDENRGATAVILKYIDKLKES